MRLARRDDSHVIRLRNRRAQGKETARRGICEAHSAIRATHSRVMAPSDAGTRARLALSNAPPRGALPKPGAKNNSCEKLRQT